jgi:hypothetical protein
MASTQTEALEREIADIAAAYDADFAGQSRATRDLDTLADLIRRMQKVSAQLEALPAAARDEKAGELLADARNRLATYQSESKAITEAKAAGPDHEEFGQLAAFANLVFARYTRHFAGQDRGTRDLGLLTEMVEELGTLRKRMSVILAVNPLASFQRDADVVSSMAQMYENELGEITRAYAAGTAEERASRLAVLANAQFELYRVHFAEQSRLTRRPPLLQRIIANLQRVRNSMRELVVSGPAAKNNKANIGIVDENLRLYQNELAEIRKVRQSTPIADILANLGGAANEIFDAYRKGFSGKDRRSIDLAALGALNDRLGEIGRQMADLGRTQRLEMNERNLAIVLDQLSKFEAEYTASAKVQQGNG